MIQLDFGRLFKAYRGKFPFLVDGSDEDSFEHLQVDLASYGIPRDSVVLISSVGDG